jgi:hypothetical protein
MRDKYASKYETETSRPDQDAESDKDEGGTGPIQNSTEPDGAAQADAIDVAATPKASKAPEHKDGIETKISNGKPDGGGTAPAEW